MNHTDLPTLAPGEAAAIRTRLTRMTPRNMARDSDLDRLRRLDYAGVLRESRAARAAGEDTTLLEAELDCRRALTRINGHALPTPE